MRRRMPCTLQSPDDTDRLHRYTKWRDGAICQWHSVLEHIDAYICGIGRSFLVVFGPSKSHTSGNISFKFGFFFKAFDALPRRHDHDHDQQRACQHGFDNLLQ